jgi:hypothetical protein
MLTVVTFHIDSYASTVKLGIRHGQVSPMESTSVLNAQVCTETWVSISPSSGKRKLLCSRDYELHAN